MRPSYPATGVNGGPPLAAGVARRIYRRIGNALHEFIYFYTAFFTLDLRLSEIQIFYIWNSSSTVDNHVGSEGPLGAGDLRMNC